MSEPAEIEGDRDADDPYQDWPPMLLQVRELIGTELALKLAHDCGGIERLYIPHAQAESALAGQRRGAGGRFAYSRDGRHPWETSVGLQAFTKLVSVFGGQRVTLPRGAFLRLRKRRILELKEAGRTAVEIALECHVTERYVRRVLALVGGAAASGGRENPRQMKLF